MPRFPALPNLRHPGKARYFIAALGLVLSTCAAPPPADPPMVAEAAPVVFETAHGPVSPGRSQAILQQLRRETGNPDILQKHLAHEQAINADMPLVLGNRLRLLQDGPATYRAMFAAIRSARDHINLETYIFEDGEIGDEFARLLLEKQAAGVQVNLIYDSVGSLGTPREFFERMKAAGVNVLEFNPVNPAKGNQKEWLLNNRDHRKLLVVDGRVAFIGGINISESYSSGSSRKRGQKKKADLKTGWRDTQLEMEGPVVAQFQKLFLDSWQSQNGPPLAPRKYFPPLVRQGDDIVRAMGSRSGDVNPIYLTLLSAISHAERRIELTNAYFAPDPKLIQALVDAARRGVDVQFILPGKTDSWAVFEAGRSHYAELLRAGVKLYERRDAVLHSKTASIDGVWSTVGSTNLDWRSFLHNDEINAVVLGRDFAEQMEAMFARDLAASARIDPQAWAHRSLWERFQEWLARRVDYWL